MRIKSFTVNPFSMNCYVYYDENTREGIILDPAASNIAEEENIKNFITSNHIKIISIINTHGHIDHILGNKWAKEYFNAPLLMNEHDLKFIENAANQGAMFGISVPELPKPDKYISEGEKIKFNGCELTVLETPGHSPGSICLVDLGNKNIFVGDCIFKNSIGRTDLPGGNYDILIDSIKNKIFKFDDDFVLLPGHMEQTTIGSEKKYNPFLNGEI